MQNFSYYFLFFNHKRNFLNKGTKGTIVSITANIPTACIGIPVNPSISSASLAIIKPTIVKIRGFCFNCSTNVKCGLFAILIYFFNEYTKPKPCFILYRLKSE